MSEQFLSIGIRLSRDEIDHIDYMVSEANSSRSEIINGIVRLYLSGKPDKQNPHMNDSGSFKDQYGQFYSSVRQACEKLGLHDSLVRCVLRGTRRSTGGYIFTRI